MTKSDGYDLEALQLFERAIDLPPDERHAFIMTEAQGNGVLAEKALALLTEDSRAAPDLKTGSAAAALSSRPMLDRIGAYRISGVIGEGGMGVVFDGVRDAGDFAHRVAIKVIRPGLLSEALARRFEAERNILAELTHPGIARLFDGGALPDGSPYMIIEYVDGPAITRYADERGLATPDRLRLFRQVLEALRHAHQNLIVHRDITPSNVLVTRDGVTKLIDFGIAKPQSLADNASAADAPSLESLSFTPGFAAPERQTGAAPNILSDIYSLGRLLSVLLQDQPGSRDLDAIIARASADRAEARYASVDQFLLDIDRCLDGRPVEAVAGGSLYRLNKLVRRHPMSSFASLTVILAAMAGLVTLTAFYQSAELARADAAARFEDVRQLASTMMFDIYNEMENVPGTDEAKIRLAEAAQTYLDDLNTGRPSNGKLTLETAQGFLRLSSIQASPAIGVGRNKDAALANLKTAVGLLEDLVQAEPDNAEARLALGKAFYTIADIAYHSDEDRAAARIAIDRSIEVLSASGSGSDIPLDQYTALLASKAFLAVLFGADGDEASALGIYREVTEDRAKLVATYPGDLGLQRQQSAALNYYGAQLVAAGRSPEAIDVLDQSVAIMDRLIAGAPDDTSFQRSHGFSLWRRAFAHVQAGNGAAALGDYRKAIDIAERLVADNPGNDNHRLFLMVLEGEIMLAHAAVGDYPAAVAAGEADLARHREALAADPSDAVLRRRVFESLNQVQSVYASAGDVAGRCLRIADLFDMAGTIEAAGALSDLDRQSLDAVRAEAVACP